MTTWNFPYRSRRMPVMADNVVATSQPLAAQAGLTMLRSGGNAVDAALATAIALTVVEPTGNGIGSDAFALVWDGQRLRGINGSGAAPAAWSADYFSKYQSMPQRGWDTVTVPGAVSTWVELSAAYGTVPFARLFEPAIAYARHGFTVSPIIARRWQEAAVALADFDGFRQTFLPGGTAPLAGERFRCPALADTLGEIASTNGASFYRGELAGKIADAAAAGGGALTREDLANHRPLWVEPISCNYRGYEVHEIPPNGQGLAALQALGILENFDPAGYPIDSAAAIHLQVEAMKLAYADAFAHLADPAAMRVPVSSLLDRAYLASRAALIDQTTARCPETGWPHEPGTVYLASGDTSGMMVSMIQSNYKGFGSGIVVPGTGISLHNRGCGFVLEKGHPNQVAGGKRPFHTIIPAFVSRAGRPVMCLGVMGAHMQAQGHVQMVTRILDYAQNPQTASDAPRWHVGPDGVLAVEPGFSAGTLAELVHRGHRIKTDEPESLFGGAQVVMRLDEGYAAASDHRKDGQAVGF